MDPIDIVEAAIRKADADSYGLLAPDQAAAAVVVALTDERIVANAVQALACSPTAGRLLERELEEVARIVLRSVGGA